LTHNPIVNPDGFLYIQQAKALHYGLFGQVLNCYEYLSPYPIFIDLAYRFLGSWVLAGQWVNIFFGTLTIIPLYWLLTRFFEDKTAWITVLVYALLPAYVLVSRDLLRGPAFWFFAVTGLYLFVLHVEKRRPLWLLMSSICFGIGAWSRIEGCLLILVSAGFLLLLNGRHRLKDLAVFLAPYILVVAVGMVAAHYRGADLLALLKPARLTGRLSGFFSSYNTLRAQLKSLYGIHTVINAAYFFEVVRHLVWFIGLGALIVQMAETLIYVFFLLLIVGLVSWTRRLRTDRRVAYLWILSFCAFGALYAQTIYDWVMTSRFLAVFLFPAFVFMGAGIDRLLHFLSSRWRPRANLEYAVVCAVILAFLLPKNLWANFAQGKLVYRQIAAYIADREHFTHPVSVCGAFKRVQVIHFFANADYPGPLCFDRTAVLKHTDAKGLRQVLARHCDYFVWDRTGWNDTAIEAIDKDAAAHFIRLHEWPSDRRGRLVLYEVVQ
jgi:4-amino-4-deoxy-L-arabinose transferase-like glycosyltransferase